MIGPSLVAAFVLAWSGYLLHASGSPATGLLVVMQAIGAVLFVASIVRRGGRR